MKNTIDISGLDKWKVLQALYNADAEDTGVFGARYKMGNSLQMSDEEAKACVQGNPKLHFDYVGAKSMKIDLSSDSLDPCVYARDNGEGVAEKAMAYLRAL